MKRLRWILLPSLLFLLAACTGGGNPFGAPTPTLSPPNVTTVAVPNPEAFLSTYLDAYRLEDYPTMYALLSATSQQTLDAAAFAQRHRDALNALGVQEIDYTILSSLKNPDSAQVAFRLVYRTALFGEVQRDITANLVLEQNTWRLRWDTGLILPEIAGGRTLAAAYNQPARGDIYDRAGRAIVTQANAVAIGIVPGQIGLDEEETMLVALYQATGLRPETIASMYQYYGPDQYVPITEVDANDVNVGWICSYGGVVCTQYTSRYYQLGGIASQTVGYTLPIPAERYDEYRRRGYSGAERVGDAGIEAWGEPYLAGRNGADVYIVNPDGSVVNPPLFHADPQPAQSITLTIDRDLQYQAQQAFDGLPGAAVVMEVETGRILAIVSTPGFDPNLFDPNNQNNFALGNMLNDPNQPLFNRATQGQYPLGSVFKIITMAAALESGSFTAETTYDCQYDFTELGPNNIKHDWTWQHCQDELLLYGECRTQPSGMLTLPQGLMRSCNPWFYHIGLALYNQGNGQLISDMARGFGLGAPTGIEQVAEASGNIPYPQDGNDATNIAIGQGEVQVTPLQVVTFTAAIANGGTLYRPQVVESIRSVDGAPTYTFQPEVRGTLPVSPENLEIIRAAMREVVANRRGTAYFRLSTLPIPVYGKTGTAETGQPYPHAWFTGFTDANRDDRPDIAVTVFVPYIGEGSDYAAPIFRRIVEIYFYGRPQSIYWFESNIGITETPTPYGGVTPSP
ncbi:MAG: penicillin-binding transpeptidase domain-containing protein [Anaerolineales bacterium]